MENLQNIFYQNFPNDLFVDLNRKEKEIDKLQLDESLLSTLNETLEESLMQKAKELLDFSPTKEEKRQTA
jgi:hypothetical protein